MKLIRTIENGDLQIIDAVNVEKTLSIFPDAIEMSGEFPDDFFRSAWQKDGSSISVNLEKAKLYCHQKRREHREHLFEPHDKKISAQIPNVDVNEIENARQKIRDDDARVQSDIDLSNDLDQLKLIIKRYLENG